MFKHTSVPTSTPVQITNVEPKSHMVSQGVVKVLYLGQNRNGSYFSKDVVNKMIPTLYGIPVVGKYEEKTGDYLGHEKKMTRGRDGRAKQKSLTIPYGYVPENAKVWFQTFLDDDLIEREYLCCDVKLWTGRYPEVTRVITKGNHQSMEIDEKTLEGDWAISDNGQGSCFMVSEACFSALCILGHDVEPCFEGAGIAHEFSLTEEDRLFLFELDKAIEKVKGEYDMKDLNNYMSVEDVKLMLQAGSGEPDVTHVQDGLPTNATVTPASHIATPAEGLATDANFAETETVKEEEVTVTEEQPVPPVTEKKEEEEKVPAVPVKPETEMAEEEVKKEEVVEKKEEEVVEAPVEEKKEEVVETVEEPVAPVVTEEVAPILDPMTDVEDAHNTTVAKDLDPVSKIDQIMVEDKDILETELLKKILELLEGRMGQTTEAVPPVENETVAPVVEPQTSMPAEAPVDVEQIRKQFEADLKDAKASYAALEAKHEALKGEFNKLKEFKVQIEMNEKEQVLNQYSLPEQVVQQLKEQMAVVSKDDFEAKCALAFVKNSKEVKSNDNMISYSYVEAPKCDFLQDLENAIHKQNK